MAGEEPLAPSGGGLDWTLGVEKLGPSVRCIPRANLQ